jgi:hypothetical protein
MVLNLFRQDIKKICLLIAFQQSLSSGQKTANFCRYLQILVKNSCCFIAGDLKAFFLFFALIFFTLNLATIFVSASVIRSAMDALRNYKKIASYLKLLSFYSLFQFDLVCLVVKKNCISAKLTNRFLYMFCFLQDFSKHLCKSKNADLGKNFAIKKEKFDEAKKIPSV